MKLYLTQLTQMNSQTDYHIFKHFNFQQEKVFNNQAAAENTFKEFIGSRTSEFKTTRINRLVYCFATRCTSKISLVNKFY